MKGHGSLARTVCASLLIVSSIVPCHASQIGTSASCAILMDADTGQILYEKDADRPMLIASTTKIMTALLAVETAELSQEVTVMPEDMTEGSSMYLKVGEKLTLETLLYGLLLQSGNDAALAIARTCGGSVENFVGMMNRRAAELGMTGTSFANPNGLDDERHFSTARDMARLACRAINDPTFCRICSSSTVTVGGRIMSNHNRLLRDVEGCIGLKTGFTKAAGRTLVSCAERNGHRLVAVTLCDGNDWNDHRALYDYGFSLLGERGNAWKSDCKN